MMYAVGQKVLVVYAARLLERRRAHHVSSMRDKTFGARRTFDALIRPVRLVQGSQVFRLRLTS